MKMTSQQATALAKTVTVGDTVVVILSLTDWNAIRAALPTESERRECRRFMDDYPGARAECEARIAKGFRCADCPDDVGVSVSDALFSLRRRGGGNLGPDSREFLAEIIERLYLENKWLKGEG